MLRCPAPICPKEMRNERKILADSLGADFPAGDRRPNVLLPAGFDSYPDCGDQEWSGYDVLAKSRDVDRKLDSFRDIGKSHTASEPPPARNEPSEPTSPSRSAEIEQMPFSMRTLAFLPVEIELAFVATAMAILLSFSKSATRAVAFVSFSGGVAAAIAVLHLTVANSDLHVRMQQQMNSITVGDENNPFPGLAKEIANLAANAMQAGNRLVRVGWCAAWCGADGTYAEHSACRRSC
jgi:hypothetical protein